MIIIGKYIEIIFNTILVSFPEEFFIMCISLILLGRKDFFNRKFIKDNMIKSSLYIVIPFTLFTSFLYNTNLELNLRIIINVFCLTLFICFQMKYLNIKKSTKQNISGFIKVLVASFTSIALLYLWEVFLIILLQYLFYFDISLIESNLFVNIMFSLPIRVIMLFLVYSYYIKCNNSSYIIFARIKEHKKFLKEIFYIQIVSNTILFVIIHDNFVINNVLNSLDIEHRFIITHMVILLIVVEILLPWFALIKLKY